MLPLGPLDVEQTIKENHTALAYVNKREKMKVTRFVAAVGKTVLSI